MSGPPRYGVYFAPAADSAFWRFGCAWLGRDPETGEALAPPPLPDALAEAWPEGELAELRKAPAGYGFHATLKPPFRLAAGRTLDELNAVVDGLAGRLAPFVSPDVRVAALGRFIAFREAETTDAMRALAASCVADLDAFRAPAPPEELAKRRRAGLSARQEAMLVRWGYPYVMDEFRFHMTLTGGIADDGRRARLAEALEDMAAAAGAAGPMPVTGFALYEQPAPDAPFQLLRRIPFRG